MAIALAWSVYSENLRLILLVVVGVKTTQIIGQIFVKEKFKSNCMICHVGLRILLNQKSDHKLEFNI